MFVFKKIQSHRKGIEIALRSLWWNTGYGKGADALYEEMIITMWHFKGVSLWVYERSTFQSEERSSSIAIKLWCNKKTPLKELEYSE